MKHFKNKLVKKLIEIVACKTNPIDCDEALHTIQREHANLYNWIMAHDPNDHTRLDDPTHELDRWTMAYSLIVRYLVIHSNIAEIFNSWITPLQRLPIRKLLKEIRVRLINLHNMRRIIGKGLATMYTPKVETRLQIRVNASNQITAEQVNEDTYEVSEGRRMRRRGEHFRMDLYLRNMAAISDSMRSCGRSLSYQEV